MGGAESFQRGRVGKAWTREEKRPQCVARPTTSGSLKLHSQVILVTT